mmetsp:Transcript_106498/g.206245  ORF Transcript_106498/g.206245 Transcript_106498/m.206245 type:complete len:119 (+) Transcript_106498:1297-1653(+)
METLPTSLRLVHSCCRCSPSCTRCADGFARCIRVADGFARCIRVAASYATFFGSSTDWQSCADYALSTILDAELPTCADTDIQQSGTKGSLIAAKMDAEHSPSADADTPQSGLPAYGG